MSSNQIKLSCRVALRENRTVDSLVGPMKSVDFYAGIEVGDKSQFIELVEGGPPAYYNGSFTIPFRYNLIYIVLKIMISSIFVLCSTQTMINIWIHIFDCHFYVPLSHQHYMYFLKIMKVYVFNSVTVQ